MFNFDFSWFMSTFVYIIAYICEDIKYQIMEG